MFPRFQLACNVSTRSQSFPCLVGFYLSCKQSWWWLYCCYCSCSSTCCCCLAAHVSRCWLGKIPVCRRRSPRHYYGTTLALLRGRQQPSGGGVGPAWAKCLFVYKHRVLIWFWVVSEHGPLMALGEDQMTWLGSMVRIMVQVDAARFIVIRTVTLSSYHCIALVVIMTRVKVRSTKKQGTSGVILRVCVVLLQYLTFIQSYGLQFTKAL